jgi:hypothetical protein
MSFVELNNQWLNTHKDHMLSFMNHTIFEKKKKIGQKFKECKCYTCNEVARKLLSEVETVVKTVNKLKKPPTETTAKYSCAKAKRLRTAK